MDNPDAITDIKKLVERLDSKDFLAHDSNGNLLLIEPNILSLLEYGQINTADQNEVNNYYNKLIDSGLLNENNETIFSASRIKFTLIKSEYSKYSDDPNAMNFSTEAGMGSNEYEIYRTFFNPDIPQNKIRMNSIYYTLARARKDTGRLKEIFDEEDEFNIEEDGTVF